MKANETVTWLNERELFNEWSLNDDVYCLHCDGVFKAQDVARGRGDCPTCPVCRSSTPIDFAGIPWWREDLIDEKVTKSGFVRRWRIKPVQAMAGKPVRLPPRGKQ